MVKVPATNLVNDASVTNRLHDIRPPVEIPAGWESLRWVLAVAVLAAISALIWHWWRKSARAAVALPPSVPPHIKARQRLQQALLHIHDPKSFCIEVSDIIRSYLEERFELKAPERTTEEFLYELQTSQLLTVLQKTSLGDFLQQCDLVKFARYEPTENELQDLHAAAHRLVDETAPNAPCPTATAGTSTGTEAA